jgi:hypothetical protein
MVVNINTNTVLMLKNFRKLNDFMIKLHLQL